MSTKRNPAIFSKLFGQGSKRQSILLMVGSTAPYNFILPFPLFFSLDFAFCHVGTMSSYLLVIMQVE